jgi:hypothetical protein
LPVIVVGGSSKSVGKTSLICAILAAFPNFHWAVVKITSHEYGQREPVWEESVREDEPKTDTARYLAAGARRALLVSAPEETLPWPAIEAALAGEHNIIYESNRIVEELRPDVCLALMTGSEAGFKLSFVPFLDAADAIIAPPGAEIALPDAVAARPIFRLSSPKELSAEMLEWLRERLEQTES